MEGFNLNNSNIFDWVDFYKEFANKLLEYKDKRYELIDKIKNVYSKAVISCKRQVLFYKF
ncbi:hypothetical protein SAMN03080614_104414 [Anaerobranca gottschalkii DSM 13577]|uniref:Uncharacterized protein n=1 Tax=Anaerobranca gottschalkii DSM 13577 TaxID=1120990 RepID=A0A1I0BN28_9FIRM|nr:hypothetical protein SAMN03080614_104414 [Anaerobranca gottschalkii DSM 13577]